MKIKMEEVKIPLIPTVMIQVMLFDPEDREASIYALEKIISPDKAISAEILRISNSAYYGRTGSIKNLKEAIVLLGLKTAKHMVLLLASKNMRLKIKGDLFLKYLEEWSLLSALASYDLSLELKLGSIKEDIFLSCLMQKIGMTVFALNFNEKYHTILKKFDAGEEDLILLERDEFGTDHIELGVKIFEFWKMPAILIKSIRDQGFFANEIHAVSDITKVSVLANLISKKLMGILENENDKLLEATIFNFFKSEEKLKAVFSESYFDLLKQHHPFFNLAA